MKTTTAAMTIDSSSTKIPRAFLGFSLSQPRLPPDTLMQAKLSEALNLANSLEEQRDSDLDGDFGSEEMLPYLVVQNPAARSPKAHADTYFGQGDCGYNEDSSKCFGIRGYIRCSFCKYNSFWESTTQSGGNFKLGARQFWIVGLIIEIFDAHAQTKEAKLQSELAALMYRKTRLVRLCGPDGRLTFGASGEAEVVSARGILERRDHLLSQIEVVRRTQALRWFSRKRRGGLQGQGLATVAVVGRSLL